MALAVTTRPMPRAITAWCVRRLCSRVSDRMARSAMTPAEPHVQPATCAPTQGGEPFSTASDGGAAPPRVVLRALLFLAIRQASGVYAAAQPSAVALMAARVLVSIPSV